MPDGDGDNGELLVLELAAEDPEAVGDVDEAGTVPPNVAGWAVGHCSDLSNSTDDLDAGEDSSVGRATIEEDRAAANVADDADDGDGNLVDGDCAPISL